MTFNSTSYHVHGGLSTGVSNYVLTYTKPKIWTGVVTSLHSQCMTFDCNSFSMQNSIRFLLKMPCWLSSSAAQNQLDGTGRFLHALFKLCNRLMSSPFQVYFRSFESIWPISWITSRTSLVTLFGNCQPIIHCVVRKFKYLQKRANFPLELCPKIRTWISIAKTCCRLSSTKMDTQSLENWTVVGQLVCAAVQHSTCSRRPLVYYSDRRALCTAWFRRTGPSATC